MRHVLHISDCHLVVQGAQLMGVDTQASLEAVLRQAIAWRQPDGVIASGDLAHVPTPEVYVRFVKTVRGFTDAPLLCLPGNHDVLSCMQVARVPVDSLELPPWSIVALDSHEDEVVGAHVSEADRLAVASAMAEAKGEHCLVATHHPPVAVNCPWLDKDMIQKPEELLEWLMQCSAIGGVGRLRGVVFGHVHQMVDSYCGGVPVYGAPSTCFQFAQGSETFAIDPLPPGYRWLELLDDGHIKNQMQRVDSYSIRVHLK